MHRKIAFAFLVGGHPNSLLVLLMMVSANAFVPRFPQPIEIESSNSKFGGQLEASDNDLFDFISM